MSASLSISKVTKWMPQAFIFETILSWIRDGLTNTVLLNRIDRSTNVFPYLDLSEIERPEIWELWQVTEKVYEQQLTNLLQDISLVNPHKIYWMTCITELKTLLHIDDRLSIQENNKAKIYFPSSREWIVNAWVYDFVLEIVGLHLLLDSHATALLLLASRTRAGKFECDLSTIDESTFSRLKAIFSLIHSRYVVNRVGTGIAPQFDSILFPNMQSFFDLLQNID